MKDIGMLMGYMRNQCVHSFLTLFRESLILFDQLHIRLTALTKYTTDR